MTHLRAGPTGVDCLPENTCDMECTSEHVPCPNGSCCQQGQKCETFGSGCIEDTGAGTGTGTGPNSEPSTTSKPSTGSGAPFPIVAAMLVLMLGYAAGYLAGKCYLFITRAQRSVGGNGSIGVAE